MKKLALTLSLALGMTTLTACSGGDKEETEKAKPSSDFKVGMVTGTDGIDDKSFNQSTWEGLQQFAKDNNFTVGEEVRYLDSYAESDYVPNLTRFAEGGTNLTIGISFLIEGAVKEVAEQFPESNFAIIDSVVDLDNVASIVFKEHEGSFLVGVAAGLTTKTNKVGFIGGVESDLLNKFRVGFEAGVKAVNPKAEVVSQYAGAFNDAAKGTAIANSMYGSGADVIYHAAGSTGNGIFTEAKSRKKKGEDVWVIGVDRDQHEEGMPENVTLTSMVKRVDVAAQDVAKQTLEGNFPGGETIEYGLVEDGVGVAPTTDNLSEDALKVIEEYKEKIKNGDIKVPSTNEELKNFKL